MMKRLLTVIVLVITLLSSCTNYRNIEVNSVALRDVKLLSTSRAAIEVEYVITNNSGSDLILASADGFLMKNRVNFAQLTLVSADTVARGETTTNRLKFNVELLDPLSLFSMGLNINSWKTSDFEINVRGVIENSKGRKRVFKFKNLPLENLIKRF